jgi:hypothetical protein
MILICAKHYAMQCDDELIETERMVCDICRNPLLEPMYRCQNAHTVPLDSDSVATFFSRMFE